MLRGGIAARPETTSTNSGGSSETGFGGGRVQGSSSRDGSRGGNDLRGGSRHSCRDSALLEREKRLDAREIAIREWEDKMKSNGGGGGGGGQVPPKVAATTTNNTTTTTRAAVAREANVESGGTPLKPRPPRRERERPASATALRRHAGDRRQPQLVRGSSRPASAGGRKAGGSIGDSSGQPSSAQSSRDSLGMSRAKKEEAALISKCRALGAARRKAATATAQRRQSLDTASNQTENRVNRTTQPADPPRHPGKTKDAAAGTAAGMVGLDRHWGGGDGDNRTTAVVPRPEDNGRAAEIRAAAAVGSAATASAARIPRRPQSAAAARRQGGGGCPRPTSRPRSASASRSTSAGSNGAAREEGPRSAPVGGDTETKKVERCGVRPDGGILYIYAKENDVKRKGVRACSSSTVSRRCHCCIYIYIYKRCSCSISRGLGSNTR